MNEASAVLSLSELSKKIISGKNQRDISRTLIIKNPVPIDACWSPMPSNDDLFKPRTIRVVKNE